MREDHDRAAPATGEPSTDNSSPTGPESSNLPERSNARPAVDDDPEPVTEILYSTRPTTSCGDDEAAD